MVACTGSTMLAPSSPTSISPSAPPTEVPDEACAWERHAEPLPAHSAEVKAVLHEAWVGEVLSVEAIAYWENCAGPSGEVDRFVATQTDYTVFLDPSRHFNGQTWIDLASQVVVALVSNFPPDSTPGPNPGKVLLYLTAYPDLSMSMTINLQGAAEAVDQGLTGEELLGVLECEIELGYANG